MIFSEHHTHVSPLRCLHPSNWTQLLQRDRTRPDRAETRRSRDDIPQLRTGKQPNCQGFRPHMRHFEKSVMFILSNYRIFFFLFLDVQYSVKGICGLIMCWALWRGSIWRTELFAVTQHAHSHGAEERFKPLAKNHDRKTALIISQNLHVYIEILLIFFSVTQILSTDDLTLKWASVWLGNNAVFWCHV